MRISDGSSDVCSSDLAMSLLRSAATISSLTLFSRITGLMRDVLIASSFGAGPLTDAFWVAFRIPNLLRRLFAEGAFSQAFVPILGQARSTRATEEVRVLLDRVALLLTAALALITVVGIIGRPEASRVGKEVVSQGRYRWLPDP